MIRCTRRSFFFSCSRTARSSSSRPARCFPESLWFTALDISELMFWLCTDTFFSHFRAGFPLFPSAPVSSCTRRGPLPVAFPEPARAPGVPGSAAGDPSPEALLPCSRICWSEFISSGVAISDRRLAEPVEFCREKPSNT